MSLRVCDEFDGGFGWIEDGFMRRASHAVEIFGRVLLFDPVDAPGLDARVGELGEPAAVVQLLDRHERDSARVAARFGVPHRRMRLGGEAPGCEAIPVVWNRFWKEIAFWDPGRRVLVLGDALGSVDYFTAPGEQLALHPLLRLRPPAPLRALARSGTPDHVLCGHGEGIHGERAESALAEAVTTARRRVPRWLAGQARRKR